MYTPPPDPDWPDARPDLGPLDDSHTEASLSLVALDGADSRPLAVLRAMELAAKARALASAADAYAIAVVQTPRTPDPA